MTTFHFERSREDEITARKAEINFYKEILRARNAADPEDPQVDILIKDTQAMEEELRSL